ncbi:MAG: histidinol-phosphatase [Erysipelotrichaceae bacterium]|nr:histidinol-phosphatase [Erysipelotrichaceae bacterium]
MKRDLHNHTVFSDGINTAEEMVQAAIAAGLREFGISDHSFTPFDPGYCMPPEKYPEYVQTIRELQKKYAGQIDLKCGLELDYYSDAAPEGLDYIIGSVHYVKKDGEYLALDLSAELFAEIIEKHFGGDAYALCERYYETVSDLYRKTKADIVGHFDLITKFNEGDRFFDENNERYRNAWQKAVLEVLPDTPVFEINFGAFNKGLRSVPYLSKEIQIFLNEHGGRTIESSDSHSILTIGKFKR